MKVYREGVNKIIIEAEESDCGGDLKTIEMATDAIFSGVEAGLKATARGVQLVDENMPELVFDQFYAGEPWDLTGNDGAERGGHCVYVPKYYKGEGLADFNQRWEIIRKPVDPPAGGEDAR
jgi:hypothetical protein